MDFYFLLFISTSVICALTAFLYMRTREISIVLGIAFIYYYSLAGAWLYVYDLRGSESGAKYWWLFNFIRAKAELNSTYLYSLFLLSVFIIAIQAFLLLMIRSKQTRMPIQFRLNINHYLLITCSLVSVALGYLTVSEQLDFAVSNNQNVYHVTRGVHGFQTSKFISLHHIFNRIAIYCLSIGFALFLTRKEGRLVGSSNENNSFVLNSLYLVGLAISVSYLFLLGNKNELLVGLMIGLLAFIVNSGGKHVVKVFLYGFLALFAVGSIDLFRVLRPDDYSGILENQQFIITALSSLLRSNEAFAPHFSFYTTLYLDIPITWGSSFINFPLSFVPSFLWPDRPGSIYQHYAEHAGLYNYGFTIHHAAGWYLNFGVAGIILGAFIIALIWSYFLNRHFELVGKQNPNHRFRNWLWAFSPILMASTMPILMRAGPEIYKGLIYNWCCVLIVLIFSSLFTKRTNLDLQKSSAAQSDQFYDGDHLEAEHQLLEHS